MGRVVGDAAYKHLVISPPTTATYVNEWLLYIDGAQRDTITTISIQEPPSAATAEFILAITQTESVSAMSTVGLAGDSILGSADSAGESASLEQSTHGGWPKA